MTTIQRERRAVRVQGIVQGVGFRPFVYGLARYHHLDGFVRNDADGVYIEVEGAPEALDQFIINIREGAPPLAVIESLVSQSLMATAGSASNAGVPGFAITHSVDASEHRAMIAPDVATCPECLAELFDPTNRRSRYPFTNCTNCGPRFTITRGVPYDRRLTTMAGFIMCPACQREYEDPANRRFHAQPNACPVCGPHVSLLDGVGCPVAYPDVDAIAATARLLRGGAVVAVKGLGGYHLACDPFRREAVATLRARKVRQDKPFALMVADVEQARALCQVSAEEAALLNAPARPIVLLARRLGDGIAPEVAPRQKTLGVMLAYTPLHHLLLRDFGGPLVMTSGNRSDEPIAYRDDEARTQLGEIADYFLVHDRPIHMRCDDSVTRVVLGASVPARRSRGYAPMPLRLTTSVPQHILACGGELKNTFCLAKDDHAFLSHHIGDLENYETLRSYDEAIGHYGRVFDIQPAVIAYDLHPEYLSTKHALELADATGAPAIGIQHHEAHVASCLADNQRPADEQVIGVAMDGTGFGHDGAIWGGEFFTGSLASGLTRAGHLEYQPLPGGSASIRQPWRNAVGVLSETYGADALGEMPLGVLREHSQRDIELIARMISHHINCPQTSSAGRLFDVVAALLRVPGSERTTYEGQAAIELELLASGPTHDSYPFTLATMADDSGDDGSSCGDLNHGDGDRNSQAPWVIHTRELVAAVVADLLAGVAKPTIAAHFHQTMARIILAGCEAARSASGNTAVALSGGTFQNVLLLEQSVALLQAAGFTVYRHVRVPTNDGGLALGQAVLAAQMAGQVSRDA